MKEIAKAMALTTVEKIVKHNLKAGRMFRSGDYDKTDVKSYHKKLLNLCYILYPELIAVRAFIEKEHPEYLYVMDFVEKTVQEQESTPEIVVEA